MESNRALDIVCMIRWFVGLTDVVEMKLSLGALWGPDGSLRLCVNSYQKELEHETANGV